MTDRQWKKLLQSGGKVDESGKVWYPDEGALKASVLMADWGNKRPDMDIKEWEKNEKLVAPCSAKHCEEQKGASGRRDF